MRTGHSVPLLLSSSCPGTGSDASLAPGPSEVSPLVSHLLCVVFKWCGVVSVGRGKAGRLYIHIYIQGIYIKMLFSKASTEREGEKQYICWYSKDVHVTKAQALTIVRLTHSPYRIQIARIKLYTMLHTTVRTTYNKCVNEYIKCQVVQHK